MWGEEMVESEGGVEHMKKDSINLFPTRRSTLLFHMRTNIIERDAAATAGNFMEPSRLTFFCCLPIHHYHRIGFLSLLWLLIIMTDTWHFYTSLVKFVPNKISGIKPTPSFVITRARISCLSVFPEHLVSSHLKGKKNFLSKWINTWWCPTQKRPNTTRQN